MALRAVLFDLDDTLHDKTATLSIVAKTQFDGAELRRLGIAKSSWLASFIELNNLRIEKTEVFERLAERFSLSTDLKEQLLADFDSNLGTLAQPYSGIFELLIACKQQGLKTGIVTNGRDQFQRSKIEGLGISPFIDSVVTSGGFGVKKPQHSIFLECLHQLSVSPEHAAFIGDDFEADMKPANALGMQPIWKSSDVSTAVAFSSDTIQEIQDFLFPNFSMPVIR